MDVAIDGITVENDSLYPLLNRAVANGPVGPAMAGPIIEPAKKISS